MSEQQTADEIVEVVKRALSHTHLDFYEEPLGMNATGDDVERLALNAIAAARPMIAAEERERAWRDGWAECKARLTDDEAFCITDDVEEDAWLDSSTRAAIRAMGVEG